MKSKRYGGEQFIGSLKEAEADVPVAELCRKYGMSDASFCTRRAKFGGMEISEPKRLRHLEEENPKLKKLLADTLLKKAALENVVSKKW